MVIIHIRGQGHTKIQDGRHASHYRKTPHLGFLHICELKWWWRCQYKGLWWCLIVWQAKKYHKMTRYQKIQDGRHKESKQNAENRWNYDIFFPKPFDGACLKYWKLHGSLKYSWWQVNNNSIFIYSRSRSLKNSRWPP